jgi:hypothetical protein
MEARPLPHRKARVRRIPKMSEPTPHWKVSYLRRGKWQYVLTKPRQPDLLAPPVPEEFGIRYLAALEGAAQLLHGAEAVTVERHPPLETPAAPTTTTPNGSDQSPENS